MTLARTSLAVAIATASLASAHAAEACPRCEAGVQARSEVWRDHFGANLSVALIPFLVIGAVCVAAEGIGRRR